MDVCLICEGSYPYVPGGVSSWVQMICSQYPDINFTVWAIATSKEEMSEFAYKLPDNVKAVRTVYLTDAKFNMQTKKINVNAEDREILSNMVHGLLNDDNWTGMLKLAKRYRSLMSDLLMNEAFFDIALEAYKKQNSKKVFNHFLWNLRALYFPLMFLLSQEIPKADIYHSVSAGYAGVLGSVASYVNDVPFLLSEHGIYTREREEDIIRSNWVAGEMKGLWIDFFKQLSHIAYHQASIVTTLFDVNRMLQIELGCPPEKLRIIPNGVNADDFAACRKHKTDGPLVIGAVLRVVPIKDVKTMLLAFSIVKQSIPDARLVLMGNCEEDPTYYQECAELLEELGTPDVEFTGQVNIKEYLPDIDLLLLTSISEGQPLAILEGFAAEIPFVATNVGDCRAMIEGERENDNFGAAGIIVPIMNSEAVAQAILECARDRETLKRMGIAGRKRVEVFYSRKDMLDAFREIYKELEGESHGGNGI